MASGKPPTQELVEGALIVVGGIVLLTPGIVTDIFGFHGPSCKEDSMPLLDPCIFKESRQSAELFSYPVGFHRFAKIRMM